MSRSTRKPFLNDKMHQCTKKAKRQASRVIRDLRLEDTPKNGRAYRKESCSWSIMDYQFFDPKNKKAYRK